MTSFNWFLPKLLAGSAQPGLLDPLEKDLEFLESQGIRRLVSLRMTAPPTVLDGSRLVYEWHPIVDMGAPSAVETLDICCQLLAGIEQVGPTLIHCRAGLGRTGTIAAAVHITLGSSADEAVFQVRRLSNYYIQSSVQEALLRDYADLLSELRQWDRVPSVVTRFVSMTTESVLPSIANS